MKIGRTGKDFGAGSGTEVFESELFRVVLWKLYGGMRTTIEIKLCFGTEMHFEGKPDFTTDELCLEQMEVGEILKMIEEQREQVFEAGKESKVEEFKACLKI